MGKACGNELARVLAAKTGVACASEFSHHVDLSNAGVLLSLPSLLSNGLLRYTHLFNDVNGYYSGIHIFITIAFLSLLRIKTLAQSKSISVGDMGRAIGLDRIPEVKTLRGRIAAFCQEVDITAWASELSSDWMDAHPEQAGILYVDGHVNIYYGRSTQMPRRYVSRMRLCMSGSTDYWINDMSGQPFFVVSKTINNSMIKTLSDDIIPRLIQDIPNQHSEAELFADKFLANFMLIFDRECYSPDFFFDLWQLRIAICTYKKNVTDKWDEQEFQNYEFENPITGEKKKMKLAERGVLLQSKNSQKSIWVREIRKQNDDGHQTSIITTNYKIMLMLVAIYLFARWSQENFFKYMMENFGLDTLVSYMKTKIDDTEILVNPQYRDLEYRQKSITSKLNHRKAKFATMELDGEPLDEKKLHQYTEKKAELKETIQQFENQLSEIKKQKKEIPNKIPFKDLPENCKFDSVINDRKQFLDTIKLIAYRAETAMANVIKDKMGHPNEARLLLKQIYKTDANIYPNYQQKTLTVEIHGLTYKCDDMVLQKLCEILNETETKFPGTELILKYKMVSPPNP